jgi:gliding motility-associated-like protein
MKIKLTSFVIAFMLLGSADQMQSQLIVDNDITLEEAIAILLGPNVEFSNVTFNGAALSTNQIGSFNSAQANVGIETGIILGTGDVANAVGPNNASSSSLGGGFGGATDPDLDELDGLTHNDAAILEFDFVATGSSVSFEYVFASEEYPEFTVDCGNVSDVFGFFLSGPGITGAFTNNGINIALIPNTTNFVSIANLSGGCDGLAQPGDAQCHSCEYYVHNGDGFTEPFSVENTYVQYDGLTVLLTASHEGLQCGETYHIKLALADVSDSAWDSGVFLKEGSFDVSGTFIEAEVDDPGQILDGSTMLEGCIEGSVTLHPPGCIIDELLVTLETSGTATSGVDYQGIPSTITMTGEDIILPFTTIADNETEGTETIFVSMIWTNNDGILDTATATLNLLDYVAPTVIVEDVFVCGEPETAVPLVSNGFGPFTYAWSSEQTTPTATYSAGDEGEYSVAVSDFCETQFGDAFEVLEPDTFEVHPYLDLCLGLTSIDVVKGGGEPYIWEYAEDSLLLGNDAFLGLEEGMFTVTVSDQCGLTRSLIIHSYLCDTWVPNIFTPNGDGKNDMFHIFGIEGFPNSKVQIYNRWGNLVFEDDYYRNTWSGDDLPDGVYYYIFTRNDGKVTDGYVHKTGTK